MYPPDPSKKEKSLSGAEDDPLGEDLAVRAWRTGNAFQSSKVLTNDALFPRIFRRPSRYLISPSEKAGLCRTKIRSCPVSPIHSWAKLLGIARAHQDNPATTDARCSRLFHTRRETWLEDSGETTTPW
jgi:hypothetical protein